jgi:hypothetical protein
MKALVTKILPALLVAFGFAAAASATDVLAGTSSAAERPAFSSLDVNHDGVLSRSEIPKQLHELRAYFERYDFAGDHRLTETEYMSYLGRNRTQRGGCADGRILTASPCVHGLSSEGQLSTGWSKRYATKGT